MVGWGARKIFIMYLRIFPVQNLLRTRSPPPTQLGEGGPLEGEGPKTHVHKTYNIHYKI
jgi:hypothetical protein